MQQTAATGAQGSAHAEQALQEQPVPEWSVQEAVPQQPLGATVTASVSLCGSSLSWQLTHRERCWLLTATVCMVLV
jgi:hypothetical protein